MNLTEAQFKRYVQIIVVSAVTCLFTLCVTLVIQFAIITNQKNTTAELETTKAQLTKQLENGEKDAAKMTEKEYIEQYAIKYHNRGTKGSIKFN